MSAHNREHDIIKKIDPDSDMPSAKRKALSGDARKAIIDLENRKLVSYSDSDYAKARKKFEKFAAAIRRVKSAWNEIGHDWLLLDEVDLDTIDMVDDVIAFGLQCGTEAEANKTKVVDKDAALKRHAARLAHKLLSDYGVKPRATKGSKYCQVAKLIHGGDDDLLKACRGYVGYVAEQRKKAKR
jgi:hypothetical protein